MEQRDDWRRRDREEQYRRESQRSSGEFGRRFAGETRGFEGERGAEYYGPESQRYGEGRYYRPESQRYGGGGYYAPESRRYGEPYGQSGFGSTQPSGWYSYSAYSVTVPRGRYTGRGPKNYRRSDERIREDVSERLEQNPDLDASEIEVKVENQEVTLEGKVEDRDAKRLAEDIVESCPGVKDVHNHLKVEHGFFAKLFGADEETSREKREDREFAGTTESTSARTRSRL